MIGTGTIIEALLRCALLFRSRTRCSLGIPQSMSELLHPQVTAVLNRNMNRVNVIERSLYVMCSRFNKKDLLLRITRIFRFA